MIAANKRGKQCPMCIRCHFDVFIRSVRRVYGIICMRRKITDIFLFNTFFVYIQYIYFFQPFRIR